MAEGGALFTAPIIIGGGLTMAPPSQLYDALWEDNERLKEQLQEAELKVTQLRLELERVTQVGGEGEARGGRRGGGVSPPNFGRPPPHRFIYPPSPPIFHRGRSASQSGRRCWSWSAL